MDIGIVLLTVRLILVGVFASAGIAKLADRDASKKSMAEFGLPPMLANVSGILVPMVEIAIAGLLLSATLAWWGALSALAILLIFTAGIAVNLAYGRKPDCHCWGQFHTEPVGWRTVVRNALLTILASAVIWGGKDYAGPSALAWLSNLSPVEVIGVAAATVVAVVIVAQGWFLLQLFHQNGRLLLRMDAIERNLGLSSQPRLSPPGLPIGAPAPPLRLPDLTGTPFTLDDLRRGRKSVMLIFIDPSCGPCLALLPQLTRWLHDKDHQNGQLTVALVSRGTEQEHRGVSTQSADLRVLLQTEREAAEEFLIYGTPGAVLIDPDGKISSQVAMGSEAIMALLNAGTRTLVVADPRVD